jgi:M6 family metalloprotease-like protein
MRHKFKRPAGAFFLVILLIGVSHLSGLEPPTREQVLKYKQDGTWAARVAAAKAIGNHLVAPEMVAHLNYKVRKLALEAQGLSEGEISKILGPPPGWRGMPTTGTVKVLAVLIAFSDYSPVTSAASIQEKLFGPENTYDSNYPYESLSAYYFRSSYHQLNIQGNVLGWYTTSYARSQVTENTAGREKLIKEVLNYYDQQGHDFTQYDNDNDGTIDYFLVFWTGPHGEWASFWWGYQTSFSDSTYRLDGKRLRKYSWQWELYNYPSGQFSPRTAIHETGHALGLPDYYDYDDSVGPKGGVGGFDMMDSTSFDHNCFSKFMLDWITPAVFSAGSQVFNLRAAGSFPEAVMFFPGLSPGEIFKEYFMVQNRYATMNDSRLSSINGGNVGLAVWHVNSTLNSSGTSFLYDNSYTSLKLLALVQADGLDEIEKAIRGFEAGDFYRPGNEFGPSTYPATSRYDGTPTGMGLTEIQSSGSQISFRLYSGANPDIRLSTIALNFGQVNVCTSKDVSLTINNDGDAPLIVSSLSRQSGASDFTYAGPAVPFSVAAGSSREITFRFTVYNTGPLNAVFVLNSNDPDTPAVSLNLSGTGFIPQITINLQVQRKVEKAWILRRGFALITIQVNKSAPFEVASYRLTRKISGSSGEAQIIKTFQESDFPSGRVDYVDKYLEVDKSYVYTLEAVDCYGRVLTYATQERLGREPEKFPTLRPIYKRG